MARKQARRKKQKKAAWFRMPRIRVAHDRCATCRDGASSRPIWRVQACLTARFDLSKSVGPFQRVTALQIEEAISDELTDGFVSADLGCHSAAHRRTAVDRSGDCCAALAEPTAITVTEQVPAAIWGERGLLNVRGELFVTDARHIPAELPRLSGPEDRSADVAQRYLAVRDR